MTTNSDTMFTLLEQNGSFIRLDRALVSDSGEGWFVSTSYRFTDWFAAETYYSELYPNTANKDGVFQVAKGQDDQNWILYQLKTTVSF